MTKVKKAEGYCDRCGKLLKKDKDPGNVFVQCEDCLVAYRMCKKCQKEGCPECGGRIVTEKVPHVH